MLDDQTIGFGAKQPLRLWNRRLGVDTPGIFRAALKATLAFFTSNAPGAISAAIDASGTLKLQPLPPAELAWLLIRRALAKAMAKLATEALVKRTYTREDVERLVDDLDRALDGVEVWIDRDFFDRPAQHPLLDAVSPSFGAWLAAAATLTEAEIHALQRRLPPYFTFSLHRELAKHAAEYAPLEQEVTRNREAGAAGWDEEKALEEWIKLTGPSPLDLDILGFLKRQVGLQDADQVDRWRSTLAELFSYQLKVGLPMERVPLTDNPELTRFREMTRQAHNAEEALLAAHACAASAVEKRSRVDWPNGYALRDLLTRLGQRRPDLVARSSLCWLDRAESSLPHALFWADLSNANLHGTNLEGTNLLGANLLGANLGGANLLGAILLGANLVGANLLGANLDGVNLDGVNLIEANLAGANLGRANLDGANLAGANLDGRTLEAWSVSTRLAIFNG